MSDPDWDVLIHRHLEGTIGEDEARALSDRLASDPALRRRLAEMAYDQAQLRDVLETETGACALGSVPAPVRERSRWSKGSLAAAASILVAVGVALFVGFRPRPESPAPSGTGPAASADPPRKEAPRSGYRGKIAGRVTRKAESFCLLQVTSPPEFAGRTVQIDPGKRRNGDGEFTPDRVHVAYLRRMEAPQLHTLDVRQVDGDLFVIGDLTEEQADWAAPKRPERKPDPRKPPVRDGEGDRPKDK